MKDREDFYNNTAIILDRIEFLCNASMSGTPTAESAIDLIDEVVNIGRAKNKRLWDERDDDPETKEEE